MIHVCYKVFVRIYICNVVKSKIIFALHSFAQKCVSGHHFFHFCTNIARCCVVAKIYILSARWSTDSWQRRKWGWKQLRTSLSLSSLAGQQRAGHCHLCGDSRTVGPVSRSGHKLHLSTCSCFHLPPPKVGSGHWPDIAYHALHTSALWMVLVVAFTKYVLCMFNLASPPHHPPVLKIKSHGSHGRGTKGIWGDQRGVIVSFGPPKIIVLSLKFRL